MSKKILKIIILIFVQSTSFLIYYFSGFSPRNEKIIIFGCWEGKYFRGNSKYLYLYFKDNFDNIESIWLTKDINLNAKLCQEGINSIYAYSIKGIIHSIRAKYFIVTHGVRDINEYFSRGGVLINLEHTTYPIKSLSPDPPSEPIIKKLYRYLVNPYGYLIRPDFAITSSAFTIMSTQTHFNIKTNRIIPLGRPKSDILYLNINKNNNSFIDKECKKYFDTQKKHVLFLPTWRSNTSFSIFNLDFNFKEVDEFLNSSNAVLGFNFHPSSSNKKIKVELSSCKNIIIFNSFGDEMNQLLSKADVLITDYSSLFADYLIYNKPIVFAKFDHHAYLEEIELSLDYDNDLPGVKVENWSEMLDALTDILINNNDKYKNKRNEMIHKIYPNLDGKARKRIAKFIISPLKTKEKYAFKVDTE